MTRRPWSLVERDSDDHGTTSYNRQQLIVEAWGQGFNCGSIVILLLFVLCNYRPGVLLHKLILLELVLAFGHGVFIFFDDPVFGWVLSATATPLYVSYSLHNLIAWYKIKPFLPRWGGLVFIISLAVVQPYWFLEMYANFQYFNNLGGNIFELSRYFEPLARDPWWIFTTIKLVHVINKNYEYTLFSLMRTSPRFGIMLLCMAISIIFLVIDVIATAVISTQSGINPYWRLALVFKCASDAIFLDDFKSVLDHIAESALRRAAGKYPSGAGSSRHRQKSGTRTQTVEGSFVTVSAKNGGGTLNGTGPGKNKWSVSRLTSTRGGRDSGEQRILGADTPDGGPARILKETTITVSEHIGSGALGSQASSEHSTEPIIPLRDAHLATPTTHDWATVRSRTGSATTEGMDVDDMERGIPMKPWNSSNSRKVGFE